MYKCKVKNSPCVPCGSYGSSLCDACLYTKIIKEIASLRAELARERERAERKPDEWERMINAYGELEGFMHTKCGHQSQSATHYCSNCGHKMAIAEAEAALGEGDADGTAQA